MTAATAHPVQGSRAIPAGAQPMGVVLPVALNAWVFILPYLICIAAYFSLGESELRVAMPALPAVVVLLTVAGIAVMRRTVPAINPELAVFLLAYVVVNLISIGLSGSTDQFAIRKLTLPTVCILPALFRYYLTPVGAGTYIAALFLVAVGFTLQSTDVISEGFGSTNSPFESILGVVFGALTVWLVAYRRYGLAAFAYLACLLFFKRNAIGVAFIVSAFLIAVSLLDDRWRSRLMTAAVTIAVPMLAVLAPFLDRILTVIVTQFTPGFDSGYVTVGRSAIWEAVIDTFLRSRLIDQAFGHGAGAVETVIYQADPLRGGSPLSHNEYLSFLYDYGVVGVVLLLVLLLRVRRSGLAASAVLLFMALSMTVENFFLISFLALGIFALMSTHLTARPR